jgi:hypothetical protein
LQVNFYSKYIKDTELCGRLFGQVLQHLVTHDMLLASSTAPADICSGDDLLPALMASPELSQNFVTVWRRNQMLQELLEKKIIALFFSWAVCCNGYGLACPPLLYFTRCWAVLRAQHDSRSDQAECVIVDREGIIPFQVSLDSNLYGWIRIVVFADRRIWQPAMPSLRRWKIYVEVKPPTKNQEQACDQDCLETYLESI